MGEDRALSNGENLMDFRCQILMASIHSDTLMTEEWPEEPAIATIETYRHYNHRADAHDKQIKAI